VRCLPKLLALSCRDGGKRKVPTRTGNERHARQIARAVFITAPELAAPKGFRAAVDCVYAASRLKQHDHGLVMQERPAAESRGAAGPFLHHPAARFFLLQPGGARLSRGIHGGALGSVVSPADMPEQIASASRDGLSHRKTNSMKPAGAWVEIAEWGAFLRFGGIVRTSCRFGFSGAKRHPNPEKTDSTGFAVEVGKRGWSIMKQMQQAHGSERELPGRTSGRVTA